MTNSADEDAVRAGVSDYIEGWFDGDAERMERALHPELAKRCRGIEGDDPDALETLSATEMIDATADGEGQREDAADRQIDKLVYELYGLTEEEIYERLGLAYVPPELREDQEPAEDEPERSLGICVTGCSSQTVPEPNTLPISRRSSVQAEGRRRMTRAGRWWP